MESVVPMLAPSTTGMACTSVIRPALMKPTTMTVVALLWTSAAISVPSPRPDSLRVVMTERMVRSFWPAASRRPSVMMFMPKMNSARPPSTWKIRKNTPRRSSWIRSAGTNPTVSTTCWPGLDRTNWMNRSMAGLADLARA